MASSCGRSDFLRARPSLAVGASAGGESGWSMTPLVELRAGDVLIRPE